ncbi:hypothetical protein [Micromonospora sp. NPDC005806]|uniref:hypothetical protein n=1 Tax=Micromonospora sp. NPDC005806 TaxID=3364234 RepID=UPI0036BD1724
MGRQRPDWVILATPGDDDAGVSCNRRTGMVELICDDEVAAAVPRTVRTNGARVVQLSSPDVEVTRDQPL